jgi:hypothetical protein
MWKRKTALVLLLSCTTTAIHAQIPDAESAAENYGSWALLKPEFESTGGGGIIIRGYSPVVSGDVCRTDFTASEPGGTVYENEIVFEAFPTQGGILCRNGRWRARDGSSSGTTPFRVFIKDGAIRRSP